MRSNDEALAKEVGRELDGLPIALELYPHFSVAGIDINCTDPFFSSKLQFLLRFSRCARRRSVGAFLKNWQIMGCTVVAQL